MTERVRRWIETAEAHRVLPTETWAVLPRYVVVDVPFSCRDDYGRDITEATLVAADEFGDVLVHAPIELVERVRYEGVLYTLMVTSPYPAYWRES